MTKCQQEKTVYGGLAGKTSYRQFQQRTNEDPQLDWQTPVKIQVKFDANVLAPVMKTPVIKVDYKLKTEAKSEEKPAMIAALTSQNLSNFLDNSKSTDDSDSESGDEFIEGSELDEKDFCGRVDAADEESEDDADADSFSSDEEDLAFITPPPLLQRQNAVVYRSFEMRPFAG